METKKIVIILIAAAIAIIAICLIITSIHSNDNGSNGQYNYKVEYADSFTSATTGLPIYAEEGHKFVIAKMIVKNDSFSAGINTLEMSWRLTLDKVTYTQSLKSELHPGFWPVTINTGKTLSYTVVFDIDKNAEGKKDLRIDYKYLLDSKPKLDYKDNLKADGTFGSSFEMIAAVSKSYVPAY